MPGLNCLMAKFQTQSLGSLHCLLWFYGEFTQVHFDAFFFLFSKSSTKEIKRWIIWRLDGKPALHLTISHLNFEKSDKKKPRLQKPGFEYEMRFISEQSIYGLHAHHQCLGSRSKYQGYTPRFQTPWLHYLVRGDSLYSSPLARGHSQYPHVYLLLVH